MMRQTRFFMRFLAGLLTLSLALSSAPAYGLRPTGLEESSQRDDLEAALSSGNPDAALKRIHRAFRDLLASGSPLPTTGLEELGSGEKTLDARLREVARQLKSEWPEDVARYLDDLDHPEVRFAVHLGSHVMASSSPPALTHLYNNVLKLNGIRLICLPLDTPEADLEKTLKQILEHPRVILITATEPHKIQIPPIVERWVSVEWDTRVHPIRAMVNLVLIREEGIFKRALVTNSDGPSFVQQFKKKWGRQGDREGSFEDKKVAILGGWGGLGHALTISILKERPRELVISEGENYEKAIQDQPKVLRQLSDHWGMETSYTVLPANDPNHPERDHPELLRHLKEADVIINATGLGMGFEDTRSPVRDPSVFQRPSHKSLVVIDSIYRTKKGPPNPRPVTPFLQDAWNQGVRKVYNGVGLYVRGFAWEGPWVAEHLTGQRVSPNEQESLYDTLYQWARKKRNLREAVEVLSAQSDSDPASGAEESQTRPLPSRVGDKRTAQALDELDPEGVDRLPGQPGTPLPGQAGLEGSSQGDDLSAALVSASPLRAPAGLEEKRRWDLKWEEEGVDPESIPKWVLQLWLIDEISAGIELGQFISEVHLIPKLLRSGKADMVWQTLNLLRGVGEKTRDLRIAAILLDPEVRRAMEKLKSRYRGKEEDLIRVYQEALDRNFTELLTEIARGRKAKKEEIEGLAEVLLVDPVQTAILGIPPGVTYEKQLNNAKKVVRERIQVMQKAWPGFSSWWAKHFEGKDTLVSTDTLWRVYIPMSLWIVQQKRLVRPKGLYLFGMNGTQGQGKTVTSRGLVPILNVLLALEAEGQAVCFATDDAYKRPFDRDKLRPLGYDPPQGVSNRGPPGTSYADLILETIEKLEKSTPTSVTPIPNYDKAIDDYPKEPKLVHGKVGVLILEGWHFGANTRFDRSQIPPNEIFKREVARALQEELRIIFDRADSLWHWKPATVEEILRNRLEQEALLRKQRGPGKGMTDEQITIFVRDYFYTWPWYTTPDGRVVTSPFPLSEEVTFRPQIDSLRRFVSIKRGGRPIWQPITDPAGQILFDGKILIDPTTGVFTIRRGDPVVKLAFELWGLRHGETQANLLGLLAGASDGQMNQLTDQGRAQARGAAGTILSEPSLRQRIDRGELVLLTSPLNRARETATIIAQEIQQRTRVNVEIVVDNEAKEFDYGQADGKRDDQLTPRQKEQVDRIRKGLDAQVRVGKGESFIDFLRRRQGALQALQGDERYRGKAVILVGHGMQLNADRILLGDERLMDHLHRVHYRGEGYTLPNAVPTLLSPPTPTGLEEGAGQEQKLSDLKLLTNLLMRQLSRTPRYPDMPDRPGTYPWRVNRYSVIRISYHDGDLLWDEYVGGGAAEAYQQQTDRYVKILKRLFPDTEIGQESGEPSGRSLFWIGHGFDQTEIDYTHWVTLPERVVPLLAQRWLELKDSIDADQILERENGEIVGVSIERLLDQLSFPESTTLSSEVTKEWLDLDSAKNELLQWLDRTYNQLLLWLDQNYSEKDKWLEAGKKRLAVEAKILRGGSTVTLLRLSLRMSSPLEKLKKDVLQSSLKDNLKEEELSKAFGLEPTAKHRGFQASVTYQKGKDESDPGMLTLLIRPTPYARPPGTSPTTAQPPGFPSTPHQPPGAASTTDQRPSPASTTGPSAASLGAGLEEVPTVVFTHSPEIDPSEETLELSRLGVANWLPALDPLEAAALKAFVRGNFGPLNNWEDKVLLLKENHTIKNRQLFVPLTYSEVAMFLSLLFHFKQVGGGARLTEPRGLLLGDFRGAMIGYANPPTLVGSDPSQEWERYLQVWEEEKDQWRQVFDRLLDKISAQWEPGRSLPVLDEWEGRRYQPVPGLDAVRKKDREALEPNPEEAQKIQEIIEKVEAEWGYEVLAPIPPSRTRQLVDFAIPLQQIPPSGLHLRLGGHTLRWEWHPLDLKKPLGKRSSRLVQIENNQTLFQWQSVESLGDVMSEHLIVGSNPSLLPFFENVEPKRIVKLPHTQPHHANLFLTPHSRFGNGVPALVIRNAAPEGETWVEWPSETFPPSAGPPAPGDTGQAGLEEDPSAILLDSSVPWGARKRLNARIRLQSLFLASEQKARIRILEVLFKEIALWRQAHTQGGIDPKPYDVVGSSIFTDFTVWIAQNELVAKAVSNTLRLFLQPGSDPERARIARETISWLYQLVSTLRAWKDSPATRRLEQLYRLFAEKSAPSASPQQMGQVELAIQALEALRGPFTDAYRLDQAIERLKEGSYAKALALVDEQMDALKKLHGISEEKLFYQSWIAARKRIASLVIPAAGPPAPGDTERSGLEEIQVKSVEELKASGEAEAMELAARLRQEGKPRVALLPVEAPPATLESPAVSLYAHLAVAVEVQKILLGLWRQKGQVSLDILPSDDSVTANWKIEEATREAAQGKSVFIAVDYSVKGLVYPDGHPVVLLIDPNTWDQVEPEALAAFLARPRSLVNLILDLTSGKIHRVTLQDQVTLQRRQYLAVDLAA